MTPAIAPVGAASITDRIDRIRAMRPEAVDGDFAARLAAARADAVSGSASIDVAHVNRPIGLRVALATARVAPVGTVDGSDIDPSANLVRGAFDAVGVVMPDSVGAQATMGQRLPDPTMARAGDLLVFGDPPERLAIHAGRDRMVVADGEGRPVVVPLEAATVARRVVIAPDRPTPAVRDSATSGWASLAGWSPSASVGTWSGVSAPSMGAIDTPADLVARFDAAGRRHGVDPLLLEAIAQVESSFDPFAVSHAGAQGLMQFMPATAAEMGVDPFDVDSAIDGAARYLARDLTRFGSTELAIAAYNAGPGAVQRHGGIPPFPETQRYVQKVLAAWEARS